MPFWASFLILGCTVAASAAIAWWAERLVKRFDEPTLDPAALTGKEVARTILQRGDASRVDVTAGDVDCYIADLDWIQLADGRFERASTSAAAIAAHEAAHALQDHSGWRPFKISRFTRDLALFASIMWVPLCAVAAASGVGEVAWIGLTFYGYTVLAGVFTVWIEVDASRRALAELRDLPGAPVDRSGARRLLVACGATYVAETVFDLGYFSRRARGDDEGEGPPRRDDGGDDSAGPGDGNWSGGDAGGSWGGCGGGGGGS